MIATMMPRGMLRSKPFRLWPMRAQNLELQSSRLPPGLRHLYLQIAVQESPGKRSMIQAYLLIGSFGHQISTVLSRAGTEVENAVGAAHNFGVVLDHHNRVAEVAQVLQDLDQPGSIAAMQPDGRLVEHVERPHQPRSERSRQLNALRFASGKGRSQAVKRKIFEPDFVKKTQAIANLLQQLTGDFVLHVRQRETPEKQRRLFHRHGADLADFFVRDLHQPRLRPQPARRRRRRTRNSRDTG